MSWYSVKYPVISTSSLLIRLILANIIQIGFNTNQDYILKNKCNKTKGASKRGQLFTRAHTRRKNSGNCNSFHSDMWTPCHLLVSRISHGRGALDAPSLTLFIFSENCIELINGLVHVDGAWCVTSACLWTVGCPCMTSLLYMHLLYGNVHFSVIRNYYISLYRWFQCWNFWWSFWQFILRFENHQPLWAFWTIHFWLMKNVKNNKTIFWAIYFEVENHKNLQKLNFP